MIPRDPPSPPGPGRLHRLWRKLPQDRRRAALARVTAAIAPRPSAAPPPVAPGLAVAGELDRASGLGEGARLMLAALAGGGVPHHALAFGGTAKLPPAGMPLVVHANAPQMAAALLRLPRALLRGRRVIGYWAWDLPVASPSWQIGLRFVHEVWVPSRFTYDALAALVPPGRLRLVPHAVAASTPAPSALGRAQFGFPPGTVVVLAILSLASSFARKNPLGVIAAFRAAFGDRPDRLLVLKLTDPGHFAADHARLVAATAGCANIRLDTRTLPAADLQAMVAACDIVLSLHRSEGFGLVPAQAMQLGVPVVATGWSATTEYMDEATAALVEYRLVPAQDPRGVFSVAGAVWAEPDPDHAATLLRRLADDAPARAALGRAGASAVAARLGPAPLFTALAALAAAA